MKTPLNTMNQNEATIRLTQIVQQAYFRRSRQLPVNLGDMVSCLKGDLLKNFPDVPIETVDDAITTSTLHDTDTPLSVAFFFAAVKKVWFTPKTNRHSWDEEEYRRPDTEQDTINLLDTCADMLRRQDADTNDTHKPLKGCIALPAFDARREYVYLRLRGQLAEGAYQHFMPQAILAINTDRMATHHHRLTKEEADKNPDVFAQALRLAVVDWLRACNIQDRKPSQIITPDEASYINLRKNH